MILLRPSQVAELCGYSTSQIRRMIIAGKIRAQKMGGYYVIDKNDIRFLIKKRKLKDGNE